MAVIAWSIPAFLIAIGIELWVARRRRARAYRFADAVTDLNCGISSEAVKLLTAAARLAVYAFVYDQWAFFSWEDGSPWPWVIGLLGLDLAYYWWHRLSHTSNVLWAAHVVHHQSEDYNLAVALRQAWFTSITILMFFVSLALLGVPPLIFAISSAISVLYQFWIHTEFIDKLPRWFEWLLNTPSHHRVHHAINPQYLDKNYAAILMIWDRMFGTFEPEQERPVYGITVPLDSWNVVWANAHRLVELGRESLGALRRMKPGQALWVWLAHPGWHPSGATVEHRPNQLDGRAKFEPPLSRTTMGYVMLWMAATVPAVMLLLIHAKDLETTQRLAVIGTLVLGTATLGGLMQGRRWAWPLEAVRIAGAFTAAMLLW